MARAPRLPSTYSRRPPGDWSAGEQTIAPWDKTPLALAVDAGDADMARLLLDAGACAPVADVGARGLGRVGACWPRTRGTQAWRACCSTRLACKGGACTAAVAPTCCLLVGLGTNHQTHESAPTASQSDTRPANDQNLSGADPSVPDFDGAPPLHTAVAAQDLELAALLLDKGAE